MEFLELIIAAFAAFMLGFAWYTALFGKQWQRLTGVTDEQANSGIAVTHGLAFLMMIVIAYGINYVVNLHPVEEQTFMHGALHGAMSCAMAALPALVIHYSYQKKSPMLMLIDGSYLLAFFALMGGVLAALKLG